MWFIWPYRFKFASYGPDIIAAQLSIGLANPGVQKKVNLTQLRNMHSRLERKSGRKAPRPGDYEVIPAPDSTASQQVCVWEGQ